jgi:hypothetical protein
VSRIGEQPGLLPLTLAARERLRDQQREESSRLGVVLAAKRRLVAERERATAVIEKAEHAVANRQATVDESVGALIETSGVTRAGILLGCAPRELAKLVRARRAAAGDDRAATSDAVMPR